MNKMNVPPIGIIITMGKEVIEANGGLLTFLHHFESAVSGEEGSYWFHKSRNGPSQDIAHVYVVVQNRILYRVFYAGRQSGPTSVFMAWGEERKIDWPRMVLAGPFEKPLKGQRIRMRGFQGFRYVYEPLF